MNFVELTYVNGAKVLVNLENIVWIDDEGEKGCFLTLAEGRGLLFKGFGCAVKESYAELKALINKNQTI